MGVAICPVLEDGSGGWTDRLNGKCLARAIDVLDKVAKKSRVKPLFKFFSNSREEAIIALLGGDPEDPSTYDESKIPPTSWFAAEEGLKTVRVFLEFVRSDPMKLENPKCVQEDLEEFERQLQRAVDTGIRWHLGMSE